ncbi:MAG: hypothetical protein OKBPIBMD_01903 [Chlorobi bacterium]|nr:hypothetical protein [Chlorobiota bacterium]MBW7853976.1 endonuclease domain-containing protein [Candidatus Kapabacteria bacterium]MCC6330353.1 endonuclease domain-containing protein [Ignavibacteria bacterium]MCL4277293.1 DUF559 domain-containing protein [Ignavibacteria bacterium]QOJ27105.1 MAG: endonuclease domain-containing protein [Ignavibacteria bacterium]
MSHFKHNSRPVVFKWARMLRNRQTEAETILWERLRDKKLGNLKFRRQHVILNNIVDFYCYSAKLIIEIDGDIHRTPEQKQRDQERDSQFEAAGFRTLRISNEDVISNIDVVCKKIHLAATLPNVPL